MKTSLPCGETCSNNPILTAFAEEVTEQMDALAPDFPRCTPGQIACRGVIPDIDLGDSCTAELQPPTVAGYPGVAALICPADLEAIAGFRSFGVGPTLPPEPTQ